jgi:hypothetical protein
VRVAGRERALTYDQHVALSPSGRTAVINTQAPQIPAHWDGYVGEGIERRVQKARAHPDSTFDQNVFQLWLLDLESGQSRALWDAPSVQQRTRFAWSADDRELLVAPVFLPLSSKQQSRGVGAAVVDVASGHVERLPLAIDGEVLRVRWLGLSRVEVVLRERSVQRTEQFSRTGRTWRASAGARVPDGLRFELRQQLDTPPVLYAVDPQHHQARVLLDADPSLARGIALGHAQRIEGAIATGQRWEGLLLYPPAFMAGHRYPLLIQCVYGMPVSNEFSLYGVQSGYGLGPPLISPYVGRLLAVHGVLVLTLNLQGDLQLGTPQEAELRRRAFEAAAQQLIDRGMAEPTRIGLAGFSRNGFYVEYTLTHSSFRFAAALAADHWDAGYVTQTLVGYDAGGSDVNGALPFGEDGLALWMQRAPGFRADAITAPLLQIEQSHGLLGVLLRWELYSRLRWLHKSVELYVVPNAQLGVHNTQNPEQLLAVQSRTIDWFRYWLTDEIDPDPDKRAQYERWSQLRAQRDSRQPLH